MKVFISSTATLGLSAVTLASGHWTLKPNAQDKTLIEFGYARGGQSPQYGVIDTKSSYLRLVYGTKCGWGTSIDTMPVFWHHGGKLTQGYSVTCKTSLADPNLVLHLVGSAEGLTTRETITVYPPSNNVIRATVSASTTGGVASLDKRAGEAFKVVFLSSMHESPENWDASWAYAGGKKVSFPHEGWLIGPKPAVVSTNFGVLGGDSKWKPGAPAVDVRLSRPFQIAGWVSGSSNPNDDNVGLWAASDQVVKSWSYTITVSARSK
jgi:hypothetical protein